MNLPLKMNRGPWLLMTVVLVVLSSAKAFAQG